MSQKTEETENTCIFRAQLLSPPAKILIGSRPIVTTIEEDSGTIMRRREQDLYKERVWTSASKMRVLSFSTETELTFFFDRPGRLTTIALTETDPEKFSDSNLQKLIDSILITR